MTYPETLDYLYTRLPMYQRSGPVALKKDLTNIRLLLEEVGNPERRLRFVHVGGTNGKGTVSHLIAAALQTHGYSVGMYTSPHYRDFRERIKVNGSFIPRQEVVDFVQRMQPAIERIQPSFFEITVAMALDFFARTQVQWVILEVGLGGRLDSTNVVDPLLSVITNIGYDHMAILGDTLPEIAAEKAGIIKAGRPVVIGQTHSETEGVFRKKARDVKAPILFADQVYGIRANFNRADDYERQWLFTDEPIAPLEFPFPVAGAGPYVADNHRTALAVLLRLKGDGHLKLDAGALQKAWLKVPSLTYFIGRWQQLERAPLVIADSAHNADGLGPVIDLLNELNAHRKGHQHIVLGVVVDKDLHRILPLLPTNATYYFVKADVPRGLAGEDLQIAAEEYRLIGQTYGTVGEGYRAARKVARTHDIVFVGGSVFTVAEVV